jgi:murein hydrolase activator
MLYKKIVYIVFISLMNLCLLHGYVAGQNRAYYNRLKNNTQNDMAYSKKLMSELKNTYEDNMDKLLIMREQINKQKNLLHLVGKELSLIELEIRNDEEKLNRLELDKKVVVQEYARLIEYAYRNLNEQKKISFVFSAPSFNKAYKRMLYIRQLSDYRKSRYLQILKNIQTTDSMLIVLKGKKEGKLLLHKEKQSLLDSLEIRRNTLRQLASDSEREMDKLKNSIEKENRSKQATKENVDRNISNSEENKRVIESPKITKLDPNISSEFEKAKRFHLWPLSKFVVLHRFGDYAHPVLKNITVKNDGIELGGEPGISVHAIFEGLVINIIDIPGDGYSIIIQHGKFYSVYSKLGQVRVKQNELVTKGQVIAKLGKNNKVEKMNFQLWKGKERLNPELWLKRQ